MDMNQYLEMFIEESKEHLQGLSDQMLILENNPNDKNVIHEIFRAAHTLKGMSGTMGFTKMQKLTHDMENVLSSIRNGELTVNSNIIDVLFQCLDALENYLENIIASNSEGNEMYSNIISSLNAILKGEPVGSSEGSESSVDSSDAGLLFSDFEVHAIEKALADDLNIFHIKIVIDSNCALKSARSFIIFRTLEDYADIIKANPSVQEIEEEKFDTSFELVVVTKEDKNNIHKDLTSIAEVNEVIVEGIDSVEAIAKFGASTASSPEIEPTNSDTVEKATKTEVKGNNAQNKTIRVDIDRLDNLMNLVSELIIIKNRLEGIVSKNEDGSQGVESFTEPIEYLERITSSLHDAVTKVRMVPVERVFNRFPRMIRDLSRTLGKDIALVMTGEETELDRTLIDEIGDPLIHTLRNAADHGLETPEERKKKGKPARGTINLAAYQDGNNVVIEVSDDGKGMDTKAILKKAIERGLVTEAEGHSLSSSEIIDFLFRPSFSTAEVITDVSGRGVGLDVVKTKIESLGGTIEVQSVLGQGTTFLIRLPLTLAIIQALMVQVGKEQFAIPLNTIDVIQQITKEEIQHVQKKEVYMYRNRVIPIVRLHDVLEVPGVTTSTTDTVVIVKKGDKLTGLVVGSLLGQQEIVIKSLGKHLAGLKHVAGATILGDGEVALILDTNSLVL